MKHIIKGGKLPLSKEQIEVVEKRMGIRLPDDYKEFLMQFNGGQPEPATFDFTGVDGCENDSVVNNFLSIHDGKEDNFEIDYFFYTKNKRIPDNVAPIARDPAGNLICICLSGSNRGKIYFWDHELEFEKPGPSNLAYIAKSFSEFFSMLHD